MLIGLFHQVDLHMAEEKGDLEPRRQLDHLLWPSLQLQDLQILSGMRLVPRSWFLGWSLTLLTGISCIMIAINLDLLLLFPLTSGPLKDRKRTSIQQLPNIYVFDDKDSEYLNNPDRYMMSVCNWLTVYSVHTLQAFVLPNPL